LCRYFIADPNATDHHDGLFGEEEAGDVRSPLLEPAASPDISSAAHPNVSGMCLFPPAFAMCAKKGGKLID
jgi:hypothetical protein